MTAPLPERIMNLTEQRESFAALVRQHEPLHSPKLQILMELRDSIAEARNKGASHDVIRTYLHRTGIDVSTDTVARFCHQVLGERKGRKSRGKQTRQIRQNGQSATSRLKQRCPNGSPTVRYQPPAGPRIVNPKDL